MKSQCGIEGRPQEAAHREVFDHDDVQRSVVRSGAWNLEIEEATERLGEDKKDEAVALYRRALAALDPPTSRFRRASRCRSRRSLSSGRATW